MNVKEYIKGNEGLRLKPYTCTAGKLTIGVGRNLTDTGITEAEAEMLLDHDIRTSTDELLKFFPNFGGFNDNVKIVLIDMMFQLGCTRFSTFKRFIAAIKEKNFVKAADEIKDSNYYKQVTNRAEKNISLLLKDN